MVKQLFLVLSGTFLITSCAQVGRISGGDQDTAPPRPVKTVPENEAVNFNGNTFSVTFDEYVRLNKPAESIIIVPPHVKPTATIKKKTLAVTWEGALQENTTYALYLNKAVKDITEGNDSVMQFVFSTGTMIDTLSYSCVLHDAYTGKPLKDHLIGAFTLNDTSLMNVAQTDDRGVATMNYLSPGDYRFIAFRDDNNDLFPQESEAIGFKDSITTVSSPIVDSMPYRVFEPVRKPGIRKKQVISASKIALSFHHITDLNELKVTDVEASSQIPFRSIAADSIYLFPADTITWRSKKVAINDGIFTDTLSLLNRSISGRVQLKTKGNKVLPKETITLELNQRIISITDSLFTFRLNEDSTLVEIEKIMFENDQVIIYPNITHYGEATLTVGSRAIRTTGGVNTSREIPLDLLAEKDLTTLEADVSSYSDPIIITCYNEGKEVKTLRVDKESKVKITPLVPGNYPFKVIVDRNQNDRWDTGSFSQQTQPEEVHFYSDPIRLRPNWESTVTFTRNE
jgi:hypothetical protein